MAQELVPPQADETRLTRIAHVVYGLQAAAFLFGITAIVAIVINYIKGDEARGTWLHSHFLWQRRTFWWGLLWGVIGFATLIVAVGGVILFANVVWLIYRVAKGWLNLLERRPMDTPKPRS